MAFSSCFFSEHYVFAQTNQGVFNRILSANTATEQAFNAVFDAEKTGANVTSLLRQLDNATNILAQAENSYRTGDFNAADAQADSVFPITQEVTTAAHNAKQTSLASKQNAVVSMIAFTVIGAFVFVNALFIVWLWFKRRYVKSLYNSKPEVNSL